ncbi:MAG: aminopeptidase P family N-terminal domain-containing protein, partial [Oscillospiraceae bacterium]|nr:aminopeptidase P family N-terminal domain-containing protein [Oscillospiraceae bacterium]
MNHLKQIADKLPQFHIDAMLVSSEPGEFYATGLHGEGYAVVTPNGTRYSTDSRYTEVAQETVGPYAEVCIVGEKGYFTFINEFLAE